MCVKQIKYSLISINKLHLYSLQIILFTKHAINLADYTKSKNYSYKIYLMTIKSLTISLKKLFKKRSNITNYMSLILKQKQE